jgi:hypothetical protein
VKWKQFVIACNLKTKISVIDSKKKNWHTFSVINLSLDYFRLKVT